MTFLLAILIWLCAGAAVMAASWLVYWLRMIDKRLREHQRRLSDREVVEALAPRNGRVTVYPVLCPLEDDDATV